MADEKDPLIEALVQRLENGNVPVQRIRVKENNIFALTAGELLAACRRNADHPVASVYIGSVGGLPPDHPVHVDRVDLEALLTDKDVVHESSQTVEWVAGEQKIVTTEGKKLGKPRGGKNAKTKPAGSPSAGPAVS